MSVLTIITRRTGAVSLARLGYRVARALEERLVVLSIEGGSARAELRTLVPGGEIPAGIGETVAEVCRELAQGPDPEELRPETGEERENGRLLPDPEVEARWLATSRPLAAVLEQVAEVGATCLIAGKHERRPEGAQLARKLFTAAPCHTLLARLADSGEVRCRRVLVPTAGGPHASVALRLGERLASAEGGEVVPLYVSADGGELAEEVGLKILDKAIAEAGVATSRYVRPRVALATDRSAAIREVAAEGFDLLLLGDSNAGALKRRLFGTVPESLLAGEQGMGVAVVRREWKLLHRLRRRLGHWLDLTIPQMGRDERVALYEKLQSGSQWNFDFMALIALSTGIAALGLIQDSGAVVIGAMLVAPLMTPILGAGLALVQGNLPLLRTAGRAIAYGYLIALMIGLGLGLAAPLQELTPQLAARGGPTLLDMGVAFLSGVAAAYCLGRPGLIAALPGVAIAAALVPPIATTGVCLAMGEEKSAQGAALLFGTNVVAIILGAAVSLYAGGVRGKIGAGSHRRWVRWAFLGLLLGAVALGFPLGAGLREQLAGSAVDVPRSLETRIAERLGTVPGARLVDVAARRGEIEIEIAAPRPLPGDLIRDLAAIARDELGAEPAVRVATRLVAEVR